MVFFFSTWKISRRTAYGPGRMAARLRVNVLLVISGKLSFEQALLLLLRRDLLLVIRR